MDLEEKWNHAAKETKIIRAHMPKLSSYKSTTISYMFLAASVINTGDTVVREGSIVIDKPMIFLPKNIPQFLGFEFQEELGINNEAMRTFLMIRGIQFPSLKYKHEISTVEVFEKSLDEAISHYGNKLERKEDITTGIITGPSETWQLSLIIYVALLIRRSTPKDLDNFFEN